MNQLTQRALALATAPELSPLLLFEPDERGPETPALRVRMEALDKLDPEEQAAGLAMIEGAVLRHQVNVS